MIGAMAAGAGLGAAKYYLNDKDQEKRDRQQQAEIARYSPWTGMKPESVQSASLFNDALQGGTMGMGMGQSMDAANAQEAMNAKQGGLIDAQSNYYNSLAGGQQSGYAKAQPQGSAGAMGTNPWMKMGQPYGQ